MRRSVEQLFRRFVGSEEEEVDSRIVYSAENFDPIPIKRMLGLLDGKISIYLENMGEEERKDEIKSLANLLFRTGHLTRKERKSLGLKIVRIKK